MNGGTSANIEFTIRDIDTNTSELVDDNTNGFRNGYFDFVNTLALDRKFLKLQDPALFSRNQKWGQVNGFINLQYNDAALVKLYNMQESQFWKALGEVLGYPGADENYIKKYFGYVAKRSSHFLALLQKSREQRTSQGRTEQLTNAFRWAVFTQRSTYSPLIFAAINKIVLPSNYYLRASFEPPYDKQNIFPGEKPVFGERGTPPEYRENQLILFPVDGLELYNMLNAINPSEKTRRSDDPHIRD